MSHGREKKLSRAIAPDSSVHTPAKRSGLRCIEILGGNVHRTEALLIGGLEVLLVSRPVGQGSGGGDIYCIHSCGHGALAKFVLLDLTGHGPARDAMAQVVHGLLHHYEDETQPAHLLELLNQKYGDLAPPNVLATAVSAAYLPDSGEFRFSNAGQPRPVRWSARCHEWTLVQPASESDCGLPLGVRPDACYMEENVVLEKGDALFLSSDGLHEARNTEDEFLEPEGVLRQLNDSMAHISPGATLAELAASFLRRLEEFRGGRDFNDDVTMLWIRRWPTKAKGDDGRDDSREPRRCK
jgi:sigma-B regulation protein RsbU (phosphoserine phosphatase)